MSKLKTIDIVAITLTVIGGLNWGFVGLLQMDLVAQIFGEMSIYAKAIYSIVGLSAAYVGFTTFKSLKK